MNFLPTFWMAVLKSLFNFFRLESIRVPQSLLLPTDYSSIFQWKLCTDKLWGTHRLRGSKTWWYQNGSTCRLERSRLTNYDPEDILTPNEGISTGPIIGACPEEFCDLAEMPRPPPAKQRIFADRPWPYEPGPASCRDPDVTRWDDLLMGGKGLPGGDAPTHRRHGIPCIGSG